MNWMAGCPQPSVLLLGKPRLGLPSSKDVDESKEHDLMTGKHILSVAY